MELSHDPQPLLIVPYQRGLPWNSYTGSLLRAHKVLGRTSSALPRWWGPAVRRSDAVVDGRRVVFLSFYSNAFQTLQLNVSFGKTSFLGFQL